MSTTVTLVGGPAAGSTSVPDPWPRSSVIVQVAGVDYRYWVREGTTTADYVDLSTYIAPDFDELAEGTAGPPGDPGVEGAPGPDGPIGAPGPVLTWRGDWSSAVVYARYDLVFYQGSSYYVFGSVLPAAGTPPTDASKWARLAVGWTGRGAWSSTTAYLTGDVVASGGGSWVAVADVASGGVAPAAGSAVWMQVVTPGAKGDTGTAGTNGTNGLKGDPGATGPPGAFNWRDNWASSATYLKNDAVYYQGSSWVALTDRPAGEAPYEPSVAATAPFRARTASRVSSAPVTVTASSPVIAERNTPGEVVFFDVTTAGTVEVRATLSGPAWDSYGYLYNSVFTNLASNDDSGGNSQPLITANLSPGRYFFALAGFGSTSAGSAVISVTGTAGATIGSARVWAVISKDGAGSQGPPGPTTIPNSPSTPPTPVGGGTIFTEAGALKYIGSSGTVTTIAPA